MYRYNVNGSKETHVNFLQDIYASDIDVVFVNEKIHRAETTTFTSTSAFVDEHGERNNKEPGKVSFKRAYFVKSPFTAKSLSSCEYDDKKKIDMETFKDFSLIKLERTKLKEELKTLGNPSEDEKEEKQADAEDNGVRFVSIQFN